MDRLPGELVAHLCSILPTLELKQFRLCCKAFADHGRACLFERFEFRLEPSQDKHVQLEQVAESPVIASKLRTLSLTTGVLLEYADYRYWQAQVYKDLSSRWSQNFSGRSPSKDEYKAFHTALQARFNEETHAKYVLYRWHLDVQSGLVAESSSSRLVEAMDRLSQHTSEVSFKLSMAEPQITLEQVERFTPPEPLRRTPEVKDPRQRVLNRRQETLKHLLGFLDAASRSTLSLSDLTLHCLPLQLLELPGPEAASILDAAFAHLSTLKLIISSLPHSDWLSRTGLDPAPYVDGRTPAARRLRSLLDRPDSLQSLDLELLQTKQAELSFELFDRTNLDRFPRRFLRHLKILSLSRFCCRWIDLQAFLKEATQLRDLTLANCRLETASMIDLLLFVPTLHLQSITVLGKWQVDEDAGEWHAHTPGDFTDCAAATIYEGPFVEQGMKSRIEQFMVDGGKHCPLPPWTPGGQEEDLWELFGDTSWHYLPTN